MTRDQMGNGGGSGGWSDELEDQAKRDEAANGDEGSEQSEPGPGMDEGDVEKDD